MQNICKGENILLQSAEFREGVTCRFIYQEMLLKE